MTDAGLIFRPTFYVPESKLTKSGYELSDVQIVQAEVSEINSRKECDTKIDLCGRKVNPVIVAPMEAVTDENNYRIWIENGFVPVVPRTVNFKKRLQITKETFASFSLSEAEEILSEDLFSDEAYASDGFDIIHYICVDIAHGTMKRLYDICKKLKEHYGKRIVIMTGNVATPMAYTYYADAGIDYMRASIGNGSRCLTAASVGIHYPTATLLDELRMEKDKWETINDAHGPEIILDGGITSFDDIQKALALGAYAVMSGSFFAKSREAASPVIYLHPDKPVLSDAIAENDYQQKVEELDKKIKFYSDFNYPGAEEYLNTYLTAKTKLLERKPFREYWGMSTKRVQKATGGSGKQTAEGISKPIPVEYPIAKWAENMNDYLASCMSYCGSRTLDEFRQNAEVIITKSGDKVYRK